MRDPKHNIPSRPRFLEILQSPEDFIGVIFYAIIVAQLVLKFELLEATPPSIFIFTGLFTTTGRFGHIRVLIVNILGPGRSSRAGRDQFVRFWSFMFMLLGLLFAAINQSYLSVVTFSLIGSASADLVWEFSIIKQVKNSSNEPMRLTAKKWILLDIVSIAVLAIINYYSRLLPDWHPWPLLTGKFYEFSFLILMLGITISDYASDYVKRIGFYFPMRAISNR